MLTRLLVRYTGNAGSGFRSCLNALNGSTQPISILFSGATVRNNTVMEETPSRLGYLGHSVGASYFRPGLRGSVTYEHIAISDSSSAGLKVLYKAADGPRLTLRNISLVNVASADRAYPDPAPGADTYHVGPVMLIGALLPNVNGYLGGFPTLGGIVFDGVRIHDVFRRPWMFVDTVDGVRTMWGTITAPNGAGGVQVWNKLGGCYVEHNRTNATSLLPFAAVCEATAAWRTGTIQENVF